MQQKIKSIVNGYFDQLVEMRRDFHQHPELGLEEFQTAAKIEAYLKKWGIEVAERINGTSVVGMLRGKCDQLPAVALRADIDALPIEEQSNAPYKSVYAGRMHACGHDVHTTIQLGVAYVLSQLAEELPGTVKFFFQQAEETVGGAKTMIEADVLESPYVSHVLGLHVCPKLKVGTFGVKYGAAYASSDAIVLDVYGKSAHAAAPHDGVDAIVIASQIVMALQTLVSRNTSPLEAAVLSFGKIEGGSAPNVIADHVRLSGTLRTLDARVRIALKDRLFDVVNHVAKAYGGAVALKVETGYEAVVNDEKTTKLVEQAARNVLGESGVVVLEQPTLGVEDFAYFAKKRAATYNRLGVANPEKGIVAPVHDGHFDVDEEAIRHGVLIQTMSVLALFEEARHEAASV